MNNVFNIMVGEYKRIPVLIKTNLSISEIEEAAKIGEKKLKVELYNICPSNNEGKIFPSQWKPFVDSGCKYTDVASENTAEKSYLAGKGFYVDGAEGFAHLYFHLVKVGNPSFEFEILKRYETEIDIGGAGCVSNY